MSALYYQQKAKILIKKVKLFNSFLKDDLPVSFEYIRVVHHYSRFSTVSGLLAPNVSKEFNSQMLQDYVCLVLLLKMQYFIERSPIQKEVLVEVTGCNRMVGAIAVP